MKHLPVPQYSLCVCPWSGSASGDRGCEQPSSAMVCQSGDSGVQGAENDSSVGSAPCPC